jgi:hypothetical protein
MAHAECVRRSSRISFAGRCGERRVEPSSGLGQSVPVAGRSSAGWSSFAAGALFAPGPSTSEVVGISVSAPVPSDVDDAAGAP